MFAAKESVPLRDGEDVRGHRKRRPRHEERRRRHSRSGWEERRLARPNSARTAQAARCARRRQPLAPLSPLPRSSCSSWTTTPRILPAIRAGAAPRALALGGAAQAPRAAEEAESAAAEPSPPGARDTPSAIGDITRCLDATPPGALHAVHHEAVATHAQARE